MQDATPDPSPSPRITVTDQPSDAALACILDGLVAFNASLVGPSDRRPLAVLVSTEDDRPQGGLSGFTAWGWLFIEKVWLADELRGQGLAGRLLAEAEAEALHRGCHGAWLDTFNPAAQAIYERQGYRVFGELKDFPTGRSRVFLQKPLEPAAGQSAVPRPARNRQRRSSGKKGQGALPSAPPSKGEPLQSARFG